MRPADLPMALWYISRPEAMVTPEFLAGCGLFVMRDFLSRDECAGIVAAAADSVAEPATVSRHGQEGYDQQARSTHQLAMPDRFFDDLHARLQALRGRLHDHFAMDVTGCRSPIFLRYRVGDFFHVHADASDHPDAPERIRSRKVSVVIFMNDMASGGSDAFEGGALTFYDLFPDETLRDRGFSLPPAAGLLVGFPATMRHEVQPITCGTRYSVVTWFS
jgi:predicted 2-oxoglutarate/Fe(II)-dependent dioxygenase YbiX